MVDQLNAFASEVSRVAREVGTEGKLGGQAAVPGVAGTWKDLTDNVNSMASNLTGQVRNIADVATAIANGDLSRKITVDVKGEILRAEEHHQHDGRSAERVRLGSEPRRARGRHRRQARRPGRRARRRRHVEGPHRQRQLDGRRTSPARCATSPTSRPPIANGDLSRKITVDVKGEILELKNTINTMVDQLNSFASEVTRVAREVGTEGRLGVEADVPGVAGTWKDLTDSVNVMGANLTAQVRNIAEVTTAVARGDLSRKITVDVKGEILELKNTINTMVDQLRAFAAEVTRVAREVGTEGRLGGQAEVPGVAGTWKDLTDSVNVMAANLTDQVRGIVKVVTAVADGNLRQKLTVEAKGEVAALAETINNVTDTLATFAEQVTNVAREVGVEGRLGGQANVPGAAGTWKDLTGNVNLLAANLTNQVRAIAEVATAVTKGDLTRSIQVEARGEVAELKDNINTMIDNLRGDDRPQPGAGLAQDQPRQVHAHAPGPARSRHRRQAAALGAGAARQRAAGHGLPDAERRARRLAHAVAARRLRHRRRSVQAHPGRPGPRRPVRARQAAHPADQGAARATPECTRASARPGPRTSSCCRCSSRARRRPSSSCPRSSPSPRRTSTFLEQLTQSIGVVLNTIEATMRTENLLQQSQQLTIELQTRQTELQQTNEQLALKAQQLAEQNVEVERKNKEVEQARRALEEKAAELALTSKYKSEFLANMSHELRTPLNSILILGQQLAENPAGNLASKQVDFARNIHSAGTDLLTLINDILDLSKIESGTVTVEAEEITFESLARQRRADVPPSGRIQEPGVPRRNRQHAAAHVHERREAAAADPEEPAVERLQVHRAGAGEDAGRAGVTEDGRPSTRCCASRRPRIAIEVSDTGIGIAPEKQRLIFEAFQQADAGTSRKYGGTGLGLAISRELATLLGGEIRLVSVPGQGSTFTLYLPLMYTGPRAPASRQRAVARRAKPSPGRCPRCLFWRSRRPRSSLDDRDEVGEGDNVLLIVDDDPHYARVLLGLARDQGFKGIVATRGATALTLARQYLPTADHPRRVPARHARLDGAEQPEARPRHAAHPGPDPLGRRGASARPVARRVLLSGQAGNDRGPRERVRPHQVVRHAAQEAAARRRGQRHRARRASSSCCCTTTSRWSPSRPAPRRSTCCMREQAGRMLRHRPAPAGHDRVRAARSDAGRSRRCATRRSSSSPARS